MEGEKMKGLYLPGDVVDAMCYLDPDDLSTFMIYLQSALDGESIDDMLIDSPMQAFIRLAVIIMEKEKE